MEILEVKVEVLKGFLLNSIKLYHPTLSGCLYSLEKVKNKKELKKWAVLNKSTNLPVSFWCGFVLKEEIVINGRFEFHDFVLRQPYVTGETKFVLVD